MVRKLYLLAFMLISCGSHAQPFQVVTSCGTVSNPGAIGSGQNGYIDTSGNICTTGGGGSTTVPVTTIAASGSSRALAFPASGNAAYDITLTANCAVTLTGGTSGQYQTITLVLRQDATAGRTPTLPAGVKWPGGTAPTPNTTAGNIDVFTFSTPDARATVIGGY